MSRPAVYTLHESQSESSAAIPRQAVYNKYDVEAIVNRGIMTAPGTSVFFTHDCFFVRFCELGCARAANVQIGKGRLGPAKTVLRLGFVLLRDGEGPFRAPS